MRDTERNTNGMMIRRFPGGLVVGVGRFTICGIRFVCEECHDDAICVAPGKTFKGGLATSELDFACIAFWLQE